jgi:hypothetical protein
MKTTQAVVADRYSCPLRHLNEKRLIANVQKMMKLERARLHTLIELDLIRDLGFNLSF